MGKGTNLARGNVVFLERTDAGGAVRIDIGKVSGATNQYAANWYDLVRTAQGGLEFRFGEFIPYTSSLATLLTVEIPSEVHQKALAAEDLRFHGDLRRFVDTRGLTVPSIPTLNSQALSAHPPKTHLVQASLYSMAFWEGGAELTFYYLSPRVLQRLRAGAQQKPDELVECIVTVRLSSQMLLALLNDLDAKKGG